MSATSGSPVSLKLLRLTRQLVREQLQRLVESKCSACGDPNAYIGAGTVCECPNPQCRFFTQRQYDDVNGTSSTATKPQANGNIFFNNPVVIENVGPDTYDLLVLRFHAYIIQEQYNDPWNKIDFLSIQLDKLNLIYRYDDCNVSHIPNALANILTRFQSTDVLLYQGGEPIYPIADVIKDPSLIDS